MLELSFLPTGYHQVGVLLYLFVNMMAGPATFVWPFLILCLSCKYHFSNSNRISTPFVTDGTSLANPAVKTAHPLAELRTPHLKPSDFAFMMADHALPACSPMHPLDHCNNCPDRCPHTNGGCSCRACLQCNNCDSCVCCHPQLPKTPLKDAVAVDGAKTRPKVLFAIANWMSPTNPKNLDFLKELIRQISSDEMTQEFQVALLFCVSPRLFV